MPEHLECDNCGNRVVPLPDNSCPVCDRLICLPDSDDDDSSADQRTGPSPLHFLARCQDDETKLTWGSWTPYALLVLINVICFQFDAGQRVFVISFAAALLSVYCTRVFYRGLSELAAHLSPNSPFWEGFIRTLLSFLACGLIVLVGSLFFDRSV